MFYKKHLLIFWFLSILIIHQQSVAKESLATEHDEPTQVKKALIDVQNQIKKLEKTVYHNQHQEKELTQQLSTLEKEMGEYSEQSRQLQDTKFQHAKTLKNLQYETDQLQATTSTQQSALIKLIQATFQHYHKEKLRLLLEQNEWGKLARLNHYYQSFYIARAQQINSLQQLLKKNQSLHQQIAKEQESLDAVSHKMHLVQNELQEKMEKRKTVLASLSNQRISAEEQLTQLQQQEQQLEQLFKALQRKLAIASNYIEPVQQFAKMKRKLLLPITGPGVKLSPLISGTKTRVKKSYIAAPAGTPVASIFSGRVVFAEWLRGVGLLIIVDHGNGYMSLYGNNQKLYKGLGDLVNQGEMIARVGQSGGHAEPGLYFEIRKDGEALDPTPWFQQA